MRTSNSFDRYRDLPEEAKRELAVRFEREDLESFHQSHEGAKALLAAKTFSKKYGARTKPHMKKMD